MSKKRRGGGDHGGGGGHDAAGGLRWLLTYTDMVTLLLALFIVMWAQQEANPEKAEEIRAAFAFTFFGVGQPSMMASAGAEGAKPIVIEGSEVKKQDLEPKKLQHLLQERLDRSVNVHLNERGVLIRIYADKVRFASGSAELTPEFKGILDKVAAIVQTVPNPIQVGGYTDSSPYAKEGADNWTLSALRAVNTVRYLSTKNIAAERMVASGFGEYAPLVPNSDPVRRAMNRRIDIQILKSPLLKELTDSQRVRQEFNTEVAPAPGQDLSPLDGVEPKPLTF